MNHQINSKRFTWLLVSLGACCFLGGWFFWKRVPEVVTVVRQDVEQTVTASSTVDLIDAKGFLPITPLFWLKTASAKPCTSLTPQPILILPHYAPAYERIQQTLVTWKRCQKTATTIKRVLVIGPDHHQRLTTAVSTLSADGYQSPLGDILVDRDLRAKLIALGVKSEKDLYPAEHGVGLFPVFIKQSFPDATLTPIVISNRAKKGELAPVIAAIKKEVEKGDVLVIITADFSHYLAKEVADDRDQETRNAFIQKNLDFFWSATDDYTDFGRGIWVGWQLAGTTARFDVIDQLSSVDVGGPRNNTTSFLFGWWK